MYKQHVTDPKNDQLMVMTTLITFLVTGETTNDKYAVWEEIVPPLAGPPPHMHPDEEAFYVLSGEFEFMLNDPESWIRAQEGAMIHIPSGALHTYRNVGPSAGKLLTIATPGFLENYFRAVGKPILSESDVPDLNQVPDFASLDASAFIEKAPEHGVVLMLPE